MATGQFDSWAFVWTFLGFLLILAGTAIDDWTSTIDPILEVPANISIVTLPLTGYESHHETLPLSRQALSFVDLRHLPRHFGTLAVKYSIIDGYNYDQICPPAKNKKFEDGEEHKHMHNHPQEIGHRTRELNRISAGMVAMLLLTNTVCFFASFQAFLGATNSSIGGSFASARKWAIGAFVTSVVTWALWLRAYVEFLDKKDRCRFEGFEGVDVVLGGSFGLFVAATAFYLALIVLTSSKAPSARAIIFVAVAGFAGVFVGSINNSWSRAGSQTVERELQQLLDESLGGTHVLASYEQSFGVYTAFQEVGLSFSYTNGANRDASCFIEMNSDGAGTAVVKGGQVTLGFAITATILSFFAAVLQLQRSRTGFWLSVVAVCCVAVSLIVWSTTVNFLIHTRCCLPNTCQLADSYGLVAAGAGLLVVAIFYQAWVLKDEYFVLPAHAYGMASQFESELQVVQ